MTPGPIPPLPSPAAPEGQLEPILRRVMILIPLGALASLIYSLARTDLSRLPSLIHLSPGHLVLATGLALLPPVVASVRLWRWLRFLGTGIGWRQVARVMVVGELGASVSPTALGSGPAKVAVLHSCGVNMGTAASLMGLGSLENALFTVIALPVAVVFTGNWRIPLWEQISLPQPSPGVALAWAGGVLLAVAGLMVLQRSKRRVDLAGRSGRFTREVGATARLVGRRGLRTLSMNLLLAAVQWSARYSIIAALVAGLGIEVDPLRMAIIQWLCFTTMTFIPTPGAAGGAEASFLVFYSGLIPPETITLAMFFWRFLTFYFLNAVALALYFLLLRRN